MSDRLNSVASAVFRAPSGNVTRHASTGQVRSIFIIVLLQNHY